MKFIFEKDTWQEIYESIRKNKLRTFVTITGVTWGIFLLVTLLGSAKGVENRFNQLFGNFATNSIFVWGQSTNMAFKGFQKGRTISLTIEDIEHIKNENNGIKYIAPRSQISADIHTNLKSTTDQIYGDYPVLDKVQKKNLLYGRFINQSDITKKKKVAVISEKIYKQLFEKDHIPIGKTIFINGIGFKVIGIFKRPKKISAGNVAIHIPFSTFQFVFNTGNKVQWMMITANRGYNIVRIEKNIKSLLKNLHNVHPKDTFAIGSFNLGKEFDKLTGFLKGMQFLTWFVGIATLIAGVFAIGNILLITVKERTKEIGIRRALGATAKMIKQQIILEAVTLSLFAGILGIIGGGITLMVIDSIYSKDYDSALLNASVPISVVLIALIFLTVLGILIGLIPANRATKINPIVALNEE